MAEQFASAVRGHSRWRLISVAALIAAATAILASGLLLVFPLRSVRTVVEVVFYTVLTLIIIVSIISTRREIRETDRMFEWLVRKRQERILRLEREQGMRWRLLLRIARALRRR